jgi:hypothetical protein
MSNKKADKQLEDLGWNKMNAMLDLEMPNKRRRGFLFYWPLLMSVAGVLFAMWYSTKSQKEVKPVAKEIVQPIAQQDHNSNENLNTKNVEEIKQIVSNDVDNNNSINIKNDKSKINNHVSFNNTSERIPKSTKVNQFNAAQSKNPVIDSKGEPNIYLNGLNEFVVLSSQALWKNDEMEFLDPLNLSLVEPELFYQNLNMSYSLISPKKPVPSLDIFQFGVHSGAQLYTSNNSLGWIAGVQSEINLNQKWSLNFSPSIELRHGNFLILNEEESAYVVGNLDSLQANSDLFSADQENVFAESNGRINQTPISKNKNLISFQLPVMIGYKLNKYLQMSLGMKLYVPLQKEISNATKSYVMHSNGNKTNLWKVEPVNYFLQAGIVYYPIHSFGISMDYSFHYSVLQQKESVYHTTPSTSLPGTNLNVIEPDKLHHFSMKLNYRF